MGSLTKSLNSAIIYSPLLLSNSKMTKEPSFFLPSVVDYMEADLNASLQPIVGKGGA